MMKVLALLGLMAVATTAFDFEVPAHSELVIKAVNSDPRSTWTAGVNKRFVNQTLADARALLGVKAQVRPDQLPLPVKSVAVVRAAALPATFDSRAQWPQCPSISAIRDQADCGSCWAFGAAEAMSDRTCIHTPGNPNVWLSAQDILSCCGFFCGSGCDGGYPQAAWNYWVSSGVVTGGLHGTSTGCLPYSLPGCDHHVPGSSNPCPSGIAPTPTCTHQCSNSAFQWTQTKHYGKTAYAIASGDVAQMQTEIMTNGPIEATFTVYQDFLAYKSGVYQYNGSSPALGGHAIRILGWGTDNGTPYWLVANSWNPTWGAKGYFKIVRGQNECGIEEAPVAGLPKTN